MTKQTIQVGIDGFRLIARRAVDHTGEAFGEPETLWCGTDGQWRDVWISPNPPAAAKVVVQRGAGTFTGVALFAEYAGMRYDKQSKQQVLNSMWASKPAIMLAKCAEALALRKAFPQDLSGLYTSDEMSQADNQTPAPVVEGEIIHDAAPSASEKRREKINRIIKLMQAGGCDSKKKAAIALPALLGREVTGTDELDDADIDALLSAPDMVTARTRAALTPQPEAVEQEAAPVEADGYAPEEASDAAPQAA